MACFAKHRVLFSSIGSIHTSILKQGKGGCIPLIINNGGNIAITYTTFNKHGYPWEKLIYTIHTMHNYTILGIKEVILKFIVSLISKMFEVY